MTSSVQYPARAVAVAAALLGLTAVVFAAMGSHWVNLQEQPQLRQIWQTASTLHMFHAAALLALAAFLPRTKARLFRWGVWLLLAGTVLFCGSLYIRVIYHLPSAALAPVGGLLLLAGWLLVVWALVREP